MPTTSPNPLVGIIDQVSILGQSVTLPAIKQYKGEPLYITGLTLDGANNLEVTIGDVGPPAATMTLAATPVTALAKVTYKGQTATSAATPPNMITYSGKPLIIRADLPSPGPGKWDRSEVIPMVEEWAQPLTSNDRLDFVVLHIEGTDGSLWWLTNPPLITAQTSCVVVPKQTGPSVNGPFGLETP